MTLQQRPSPDPQPEPEVASRLHGMGLRSDDLRNAILAGNDEALGCTANDVVTRAGYIRWSTPLRYLGDMYVPKGFTRERPRNFEMLVSPDRRFALAVAPGDHATGTERIPSTRIERGPLTGQAVMGNRHQLGFGAISPEFTQSIAPTMTLWLLLQFFDEQAEEVRLELSLPVEFTLTPASERGFVTGFEPRLILPAISLGDTAEIISEDEDGQIDVPVARR